MSTSFFQDILAQHLPNAGAISLNARRLGFRQEGPQGFGPFR